MNQAPRGASVLLSSFAILALASAATADIIVNTAPIPARFVQVADYGTVYREFHLGEVEVFGFGVSPNGGAGLSSNDIAATFEAEGAASSWSVAHGANTAPVNNALDTGATTYDRLGVGAYYTADLGSTQNVGTVRAWQRLDCCWERLKTYTVSLLADNGSGLPGAVVASQLLSGQTPTNSYSSFDFAGRLIRPGGPGAIGTETILGTDARYVQATTPGTGGPNGNVFHIAELRAYDPLATNVALATQGSSALTIAGGVFHGADSALIDGVLDTGANTWTRGAGAAGALVDFGQGRFITSVTVHQRNDGCCQDRLQNFSVTLLGADLQVNNTQYYPGQVPTNSFATFTMPDFLAIGGNDVLAIEIDGTAGLADKLRIGAAGLGSLVIRPGATLDVSLIAGQIEYGDSFDLMDWGTLAGRFAAINLPEIGPDLVWDLNSFYATGQVTATPEPATLSLLALGALGFLRRRRRP